MREMTIDERDFAGPKELMAWLKAELDLPEWFGSSLPALYDLLGDICEPTTITVVRRDPTPDTWFDKATMAIVRSAMQNEYLRVRIR